MLVLCSSGLQLAAAATAGLPPPAGRRAPNFHGCLTAKAKAFEYCDLNSTHSARCARAADCMSMLCHTMELCSPLGCRNIIFAPGRQGGGAGVGADAGGEGRPDLAGPWNGRPLLRPHPRHSTPRRAGVRLAGRVQHWCARRLLSLARTHHHHRGATTPHAVMSDSHDTGTVASDTLDTVQVWRARATGRGSARRLSVGRQDSAPPSTETCGPPRC